MNKMRKMLMQMLLGAVIVSGVALGPVWANDLDDGIPVDEPVDDGVKVDTNFTFIVVDAETKARAKASGSSGNTVINSENGLGNINIGAGADLSGATIINLSNNEDSTVIAK